MVLFNSLYGNDFCCLLWRWNIRGVYVTEPWTLDGVLRVNTFRRIEFEHLVNEIECGWRHEAVLLTYPPFVKLFHFERLEEG